jgi:tetratricopeptide (TPR) repeat protein
MRRRTLLCRAGTVAVLGAFAGCSSGDGGDATTTTGTTTTTTETTTETTATESTTTTTPAAAEHIEAAKVAIGDAADALGEQSDRFSGLTDGEGVDVSLTAFEGHLGTAREELDAAAETASADQQDRIEALRSLIEWLAAISDTLDTFADGYTTFQTGLTLFQSDRYGDAIEKLDTSIEQLNGAADAATVAADASGKLDAGEFESAEEFEVAEIRATMEELRKLIDAMVVTAEGFQDMTRGMKDFSTAAERYDGGEYVTAQETFEDARDDFGTAEATFRDAEGTVPTQIESSFVELTCFSGALKDSADLFAQAASAAESGDEETARQKAQEASSALDRCNFDA